MATKQGEYNSRSIYLQQQRQQIQETAAKHLQQQQQRNSKLKEQHQPH